VNRLPFSTTNDSTAFTIEGEPPPLPGQGPGADFRAASPAYFQALSIPVLRGRAFAEGDTADAPPVLLVNETLARRYFGDADPIGRRLRFGGADGTGPWRTIVGVVGDVKHWDLTRSAAAEIYMPLAQDPEEAMTLVIKTATPAPALAADVRQALASVDPDQPVFDITTLEALIDESLLSRRLAMQMVGLFGLAALVLAAVGLYGVIACSVAEQAHDIGVRVALGASPRHISGAVVRQGAGLAAAGIALGLAGAALVTRGLSALLYGVTAIDPATYVIGAALLAGTAVLSAWIPARRAARVDPADTLRA
jgi:putative ABC transport system permease protein